MQRILKEFTCLKGIFVWLVGVLLSLSCIPVQAQLLCTNNTSEPVWVAIAYHFTPKYGQVWEEGNWVSDGWFYITPGKTLQLHSYIGVNATLGLAFDFYYFAFQPNGKEWRGSRNFLTDIDPNKKISPDLLDFRIFHADNTEAYPEMPYYVPFEFKFATRQRSGSYTIELKVDDKVP